MSTSSEPNLHIYDNIEARDERNAHILWWNHAVEVYNDKHFSITEILEDRSESTRSKYLSFIYKIGNTSLKKINLIDRLSLDNNFSFWWMSAIAKKCHHSKSSRVADTLKILAFTSWVRNKNYTHVNIHCQDARLVNTLVLTCGKLGLNCTVTKFNLSKTSWVADYFSRSIFIHVVAALWALFRYLWSRRVLMGVGVKRWSEESTDSLIVSYSDNLDVQYLEKGQFYSRYWETLPDVMESVGSRISFLHLYDPDPILPNPKDAAKIISLLNVRRDSVHTHITLDSFINAGIICNCMIDWIRIIFIAVRMRKLVAERSGHMWPLIEEDYYKSFFGFHCIKHLLLYKLFERSIALTGAKENGFYLQENQGWEFALIDAWRKAKHDQLVGVVHIPVSFWDLRMKFDARSYVGSHRLPLPDAIGVNSYESLRMMDDMALHTNVIPLEALRYLHLLDQRPKPLQSNSQRRRLLVLGDYLLDKTQRMLALLQLCSSAVSDEYELVIKFHPNTPISSIDVGAFSYCISSSPIGELLDDCDIAFTSDSSTAALDAYCKGKTVISLRDLRFLNLSPLKDVGDVYFVTTKDELISALAHARCNDEREALPEYFFMGKELARWRSLLEGGVRD